MDVALGQPRSFVKSLFDGLRERREANAAYEALRRDLSSYRTAHEVDDILGVIKDQDGPEAQQIRDILSDTQLAPSVLYRVA